MSVSITTKILIFVALIFGWQNVHALEPGDEVVRFRDHYELNEVGDAKITRTYTFSPAHYAEVKAATGDPLRLLMGFTSSLDWRDVEIVDCHYDDANTRIVVELEQSGMAKSIESGKWEIKSRAKPGTLELITCRNDRVVIHTADASDWGPMSATISVNFVAGTEHVAFDEKSATVSFEHVPANSESIKENSKKWSLEAKPTLMTALSKIYSNDAFTTFWTARSIFQNQGDEPITRFQVRYQIEGLSSWSQWNRSAIVYPGQTVVEGFFPVLDIDELNQLQGRKTASVIAEYEYIDAEGNKVQEKDTHDIELLPRNEVFFGSNSMEQKEVTWGTQHENLPIIVAAFCNSNESVVQQLAGRISGMAHGASSSYDPKEAANYLYAIWKFVEDNGIAVEKHAGAFDETIRFPRDLLVDRSGTPLDFAIFWASTAKAVGLSASILVTPTDAIAVIELPNGAKIPIAVEMHGQGKTLDDAYASGSDRYQTALNSDEYFLIDVAAMETYGVRAIELSRVEDDFLANQKLTFEPLPVENDNN
ncbi:MAG: hypothetical protein R3C03_23080 [Pirellulaceae bacterium]